MVSFRSRGLSSLPTLVAEIIGLLALGTSLVFGQGSTGAITGTVKDMSGAAVERAAITVRHIETGLTLNVGVTNASSNTLNGTTWNMFSVAGKRPETNRFTINGTDWLGGSATGQFITPFGASGKEAARGGGHAGIKRSSRHLWRRVRQTVRRAGQRRASRHGA
jgi:hypothetical protein